MRWQRKPCLLTACGSSPGTERGTRCTFHEHLLDERKPRVSWSLLASPASPLSQSEKRPSSSSARGSSLNSLPLSSGELFLPFRQSHSLGFSVTVSSHLVPRISLLTAMNSSLSLDYRIGSYIILCVNISLQMVSPV